PSISLFLGLGFFIQRISLQKKSLKMIISTFAIVLILSLGVLTFKQNRTWSDPVTFYNYILRFESGSLRVHNNLGMAYSDRGNISKAIEHYKKASEISPEAPQPLHNLGLLYLRSGDIKFGIKYLKDA